MRLFSLLLMTAALLAPLDASLFAQRMPPSTSYWAERPSYIPESERHPRWYTVGGERDGPSMFPRVQHPEVEYEPGEELTWDIYHTPDVMYYWMWRWEEEYPDLIEVYEVGRTFEGRPIYQATITNKNTGSHTDKPAAYFDGGRHSGEVTSMETVLWLMQYLLENYGRDTLVTRVVDTKTIYARPVANPDGSNLYLHTAQRNRSSVRPVDSDRNGLLDANPPVDLDGDGVIRQMRWYVGEGEGTHVIDDRDPRLMRRVGQGQGDYMVATEGIDHTGEGRYGSDGIGGLDLHRNSLANWRPMPGFDETGRGYTQGGAGEYPLSEPEIYWTVMWMLTHPNISVVNSMDTSAPFHLRGPSTSASEERMYPEDLELFEYFDSLGMSITGYARAGDVYQGFLGGRPLFGHGPDFGYWYYGSLWYGDELWHGARFGDLNEDGRVDDLDRLIWDDRYNEGRAWQGWNEVIHPQLGKVEVGGFDFKFFRQNPPPQLLEEWAKNQALFNLAMVQRLPHLAVDDVSTVVQASDADSTTYDVTVRYTNQGHIPTALRQAELVKIVRPDAVSLRFEPQLTRGVDRRVRILQPSGGTISAGRIEGGETKEVTFRVRVYGQEPVEGLVRLSSTRGGVVEAPMSIGR